MNILKGRIEAAKTRQRCADIDTKTIKNQTCHCLTCKMGKIGKSHRVDAASGLLEKAVEKRASLALLGDADKKVGIFGLTPEPLVRICHYVR